MREGTTVATALVLAGLVTSASPLAVWAQANPYTDALLPRIRTMARAAPAARPQSLHFLSFAQAQGTRAGGLEDGDSTPTTAVFPVFQIRFAREWIMVDAGFDRASWDEFSKDWPVTYWQERYERTLAALRGAKTVVLTHEHWDHAAGLERGPRLSEVVGKALLTSTQLHTFLEPPAPEHYVRIDSAWARRYRTIDYDLVYSLAPGVVLIKAPGHTPGAQFVYLQLASGEELLLVGDLVWLKEGLEWGRQKPPATSRDLKEDRHALQQEIDWVRHIVRDDRVIAIPSHDSRVLQALVGRGLLRKDLDIAASE